MYSLHIDVFKNLISLSFKTEIYPLTSLLYYRKRRRFAMKKSMTWTTLVTLGLSSVIYLSPVEAATDEFTVETKNINTRTEV